VRLPAIAAIALLPTAASALVPMAVVALLPTAASAAPVASTGPVAGARLQGTFELAGRVTIADDVVGERAGETVARTWTLRSSCPIGQCPTVNLVRRRAQGVDVLVLRRRGAGRYAGNGSFYSPLVCARRVYPRGQKAPFTITIRITEAAQLGSTLVATRISATYDNRRRINRTPCVGVVGHDAARYHGHIEPAA
jgi:hypothetical protein